MFQVYLTLSLSYLSRFFQESCFLLRGQRDLETTTWESGVLFVVAVWLLSALSGESPREWILM